MFGGGVCEDMPGEAGVVWWAIGGDIESGGDGEQEWGAGVGEERFAEVEWL